MSVPPTAAVTVAKAVKKAVMKAKAVAVVMHRPKLSETLSVTMLVREGEKGG